VVLDHQHDDAWIREQGIGGGFGGGAGIAWLPDNKRFLFLSEKTGYLQMYSVDMSAAQPIATALTSGSWEVTSAELSNDRTKVFLQTNEVHPGERHFYTMSVDGGPRTKVTTMAGSNDATVSPDERTLALIHSYATKPPELHMMPFAAEAAAVQVTTTPSDEWRAFKWIDPKVVTYKARDGQDVYARLYTPEMVGAKRDPRKPAVVFVHGAGYLQNAHNYWSTYYREYMFHHILASKGYVVLDPDYRASSGYGRDWRTGIYRFMGGKDLEERSKFLWKKDAWWSPGMDQAASGLFQDLVDEMERRYRMTRETGSDNLREHVERSGKPLARIVCVCDEYYALVSQQKEEKQAIEQAIGLLGAKGRAAGIHLILATQQPSRQTINGAIQANLPCRVALYLQSPIESNMIINQPGAERLTGMGDLLYKDFGNPVRLQGAYLPDAERAAVLG
jgi:hypothetical protein